MQRTHPMKPDQLCRPCSYGGTEASPCITGRVSNMSGEFHRPPDVGLPSFTLLSVSEGTHETEWKKGEVRMPSLQEEIPDTGRRGR